MINYNRMCVPICYTCINDAAYPVLLWSFSLFPLHTCVVCVCMCLHNAGTVINLLLFCIYTSKIFKSAHTKLIPHQVEDDIFS